MDCTEEYLRLLMFTVWKTMEKREGKVSKYVSKKNDLRMTVSDIEEDRTVGELAVSSMEESSWMMKT